MTSDLAQRLRADRALRNAAHALVRTDLANLKHDWNDRGLAARSVDRLKEGATDVYDEAVSVASDHRGVLVALLAAISVWFARHPIVAAFSGSELEKDFDPEGPGPADPIAR